MSHCLSQQRWHAIRVSNVRGRITRIHRLGLGKRERGHYYAHDETCVAWHAEAKTRSHRQRVVQR